MAQAIECLPEQAGNQVQTPGLPKKKKKRKETKTKLNN
jgi:hypothetical protein